MRDGSPTAFPHLRLRSLKGTTAARGLIAAVLAAAALIAAANAGPARATQAPPPTVTHPSPSR
ncbi:hypothetical protein [Streptomyces sp. NPDC001508]|uniref:hypothetical protein n=1 Tax=Streptomyces sp. NPDC001508 TaxID=3154656 RepID=UPI00332057B3